MKVLGHPERLIRVLVNLLTNAYRYGGNIMRLTVRRDGPHVVLEVEDDGEGVPATFVPELFEPFTRGTTTGEHGAGLGLAISRGIVEDLGGTITYAVGVRGGARFVVRLQAAS